MSGVNVDLVSSSAKLMPYFLPAALILDLSAATWSAVYLAALSAWLMYDQAARQCCSVSRGYRLHRRSDTPGRRTSRRRKVSSAHRPPGHTAFRAQQKRSPQTEDSLVFLGGIPKLNDSPQGQPGPTGLRPFFSPGQMPNTS